MSRLFEAIPSEEELAAEKTVAQFAVEGFGAPDVPESGGESFDAPDEDGGDGDGGEVGDTGDECADAGDVGE